MAAGAKPSNFSLLPTVKKQARYGIRERSILDLPTPNEVPSNPKKKVHEDNNMHTFTPVGLPKMTVGRTNRLLYNWDKSKGQEYQLRDPVNKPNAVPVDDEFLEVLPPETASIAWQHMKSTKQRPSLEDFIDIPEPPPAYESATATETDDAELTDAELTPNPQDETEEDDDEEDVAMVIEESLDDTENAEVVEQLRQPNNCNVALVPPRASAFQAPCITLPRPKKEAEPESSDDEDGMSFCFYPQGTHATEVTFTVEPKRPPQWLSMMRCGFVPIMNCAVPPCCLPERGRRNGAYLVRGSSSSSSGSSTSSSSGSTSSVSGSDSDSEGEGSSSSSSDSDTSKGSKSSDATSAEEEEYEEKTNDQEKETVHSNAYNSLKPGSGYSSHTASHVHPAMYQNSYNSMYMHQYQQHKHHNLHHQPHHFSHHHGHHRGHHPDYHLGHSAAGTGEGTEASSEEESSEDEKIEAGPPAIRIGPTMGQMAGPMMGTVMGAMKTGVAGVGAAIKNRFTAVKSILKKKDKAKKKEEEEEEFYSSSSASDAGASSSGSNEEN